MTDRGRAEEPDPTVRPELREKAHRLRELVQAAAERAPAEAILLSGGLDTSVIAYVARAPPLRTAVTVVVGERAPDEEHAIRIARARGLEHHLVRTDLPGLLEELPFVVRVMKSFDPMELRNSIVVARGLRELRDLGARSTWTGDAADELFGGYSFLWSRSEEEFARSSEKMSEVMRFSSFPMGEALGVTVRAPYLDPHVVEFSRHLSKGEKVATLDGTTHGKYLLRLAFPEVPNRWRRKDPIEVGSGSTALPAWFRDRTPKDRFAGEQARILREDGVAIRDPEHLAYYEEFRRAFGDHPPVLRGGPDPCQGCGFELSSKSSDFCVTCGAWPARRPAEQV